MYSVSGITLPPVRMKFRLERDGVSLGQDELTTLLAHPLLNDGQTHAVGRQVFHHQAVLVEVIRAADALRPWKAPNS